MRKNRVDNPLPPFPYPNHQATSKNPHLTVPSPWQIVFMFYETEKPGLTTDHLAYHGDALARSYQLWKDEKKGFLSTFPFGVFAYARLDDRLSDSQLWTSAERRPGRDPMGLTPKQPNIEFFTTECYGGPKQYDQFPIDYKHAFSMIAELFGPRSRGSVRLRSTDPTAPPVVDTGYLTDPLDLEVLAEACRFGNEIVMEGKGTKDIVKGSWPPQSGHHEYKTREDWKPYVKKHATTCECWNIPKKRHLKKQSTWELYL